MAIATVSTQGQNIPILQKYMKADVRIIVSNKTLWQQGGCVKTLLFLKNHKALTFTSQGFAMSKSCCNFRP